MNNAATTTNTPSRRSTTHVNLGIFAIPENTEIRVHSADDPGPGITSIDLGAGCRLQFDTPTDCRGWLTDTLAKLDATTD